MAEPLVIAAVGDIGPRRADPAAMFAPVRPALTADLLFGQMECVLSDRGTPAPNARLPMRTAPSVAAVLAAAGFDILSVAGNHAMDYGAEALADTLAHLNAAGLATCGAGMTSAAARAPALLTAGGRRVVCLAYSAILPAGYAADQRRAGCAPLHVHTHYEQIEPDQPGTDPRILTFAAADDLQALIADVQQARTMADHVIVSMHWGLHFVRARLADYQRVVGRAVIDAGADAIFGHHPHLLKGVEFHHGRPIIHSLGNFAIEQPSAFMDDIARDSGFQEIRRLNSGWQPQKPYMNPEETRHTMVARLSLAGEAVGLQLIPCRIDDDSVPHILPPGSNEAAEWLAYLQTITQEAGLVTRYVPDADGAYRAVPA